MCSEKLEKARNICRDTCADQSCTKFESLFSFSYFSKTFQGDLVSFSDVTDRRVLIRPCKSHLILIFLR